MKQPISNLIRRLDRPVFHRLFWVLLAYPYFKPAIFAQVEMLAFWEDLFNYWRVLSAAAAAVLYGAHVIRRRRISPVMLGLMIMEGAILVSTFYQSRNYFYALNTTATILSFCMLIEVSLEDDPAYTLDAAVIPLLIQLTMNFFFLMLYPRGIVRGGNYNNAFNYMAIDNQLCAFILPWIVMTVLRDTSRLGELGPLSYYALWMGMETELLVWSATGMVTVLMILLFCLFFYLRRGEILSNFLTAMGVTFGLFFGIIILRLQKVLAFFVTGVLKKGLSFTGRTEIWDEARRLFLESPWLGKGLALRGGKVYRLRKGRYYPAHTIIYEVLIQGGVVAFSGFMLMLCAAGKRLMEYRRHPYACLLSAGLICYGLVGSMESYIDNNAVLIFGMLFLSYHLPTLVSRRDIPELKLSRRETVRLQAELEAAV